MPIKWSAVQVSEAMDEVEQQVLLADQFVTEAKAEVEAAKKIANLPQYMEQRLYRIIDQLNRMDNIKGAIEAVRKDIPDGAIEAEKGITRHGRQQRII